MKINRVLKYIGNNNSKYKNYKGIGEIDENNLKQGYWEYYYSNGKIKTKVNYVNGYKEGYWEKYWRNGKLCSKGNFKNGIQDGYWEVYYDYGQLYSKGNYVNGKFYEDK